VVPVYWWSGRWETGSEGGREGREGKVRGDDAGDMHEIQVPGAAGGVAWGGEGWREGGY